MKVFLQIFLAQFFGFIFVKGCQLSGYESGICVDSTNYLKDISFCQGYLYTNICIPLERVVWPTYTTNARDSYIKNVFIKQIEQRLISEISKGVGVILLYNNQCYYAYKQFLCQWNFPPCDIRDDQTLPICMSQCTSYYNACQSDSTSCELSYQQISPGLDSTC
ncbi:hypothetical protein ABPG72_016574 [Tetrahymena utriculariae]